MALTFTIFVLSLGFLLYKAASFAKNNPGTSIKAASLLKDMFK